MRHQGQPPIVVNEDDIWATAYATTLAGLLATHTEASRNPEKASEFAARTADTVAEQARKTPGVAVTQSDARREWEEQTPERKKVRIR